MTKVPLSNDWRSFLCEHSYMMNAVKEGWTARLKLRNEDSGEALVRILLVDDFEPIRTLVSSILAERPGYQIVGEASDGLEAVQRARECQPDLVVLDMALPELDGIEAARRIRLCSPDSRILFLTANNDPELARYVLNEAAEGYVLKIDLVAELTEAAEAVLSGNRYVSRRLRDQV